MTAQQREVFVFFAKRPGGCRSGRVAFWNVLVGFPVDIFGALSWFSKWFGNFLVLSS